MGRQPGVEMGLVHAFRTHYSYLVQTRRLPELGTRLRGCPRAGTPRGRRSWPRLLGSGQPLSEDGTSTRLSDREGPRRCRWDRHDADTVAPAAGGATSTLRESVDFVVSD